MHQPLADPSPARAGDPSLDPADAGRMGHGLPVVRGLDRALDAADPTDIHRGEQG